MYPNKPLTYLCSRTVLQYLSFSRRKQFYLTCTEIRKTEENVLYCFESVRTHSTNKNVTIVVIDGFEFRFWKQKENFQLVVQNTKKLETLVSQTVFEQEADDKFLLYYFNREGTVIKNLEIEGLCRWMLECKLKAIKNLGISRFQETVNTEILLNSNCQSISVGSRMKPAEFLDYCRSLATRADRPIGSVFKMNIGLFSSTRNAYFDLVHSHMNAKITLLDGEKYATIPMNESKELIIYCDKNTLVVEVYSSGTRVESNKLLVILKDTRMSTISIYESTFSQSDKTDAILVVEDKKLHVNKALLSCHSDYFKTLFNEEFKEKSMPEIPITDVEFEDFATLLSLIQKNTPINLNCNWMNPENLLKLADRFLMPAAKRHVELFIALTNMDKFRKLKLADKYDLEVLLEHALKLYTEREDYRCIREHVNLFSDKTKAAIFNDFFHHFGENL